jgi:hypothetical protein
MRTARIAAGIVALTTAGLAGCDGRPSTPSPPPAAPFSASPGQGAAAGTQASAAPAGSVSVPGEPGGLGCVRTSPVPPRLPGDTTLREHDEDIRPGVVFRCVLHRGQAPVRMALRADPDFNVAVDVRVYRPAEAARPAQVLVLDDANAPPPLGQPFFEGVDLNGDGWMDLKVLKTMGATGNRTYDLFMYSPARAGFVRDTTIGSAGPMTPVENRCVLETWNMGAANRSAARFCWRGERWLLAWSETVEPLSGHEGRLVTVSEYRGGRLHAVRVDTCLSRDDRRLSGQAAVHRHGEMRCEHAFAR